MATTSLLSKVFALVEKFVTSKKGCWDHSQWEEFLASAAKIGVTIDDESKRTLGNMLESAKFFYCCAAACDAPAPKKASAKAKPKAKSKPKTK
ncbi:MAG TPA: hypothetical protein PLO62_15240 [Candidatus Hydrogenedentes bacterium]|nr:hypothetical protein [Candidatus Hydrogenedentota bacterium]HOS03868.1 hypothetical protein [Candidatus Hydrogenedentota bacterium]